MPDTLPVGADVNDNADALREAAAAAVSAIPGVTQLEPTLSNALRRLNSATRNRTPLTRDLNHSAADGIRLTRHDNLIDIHVDISTNTARPAGAIAKAVHAALADTVKAHRLEPGHITVSVLRLKPPS